MECAVGDAAASSCPVLFYWSGGKDSAMALYEIRNQPKYRTHHVSNLLTTLTSGYDRISGHGVRSSLLELQARALGLDLHKTYIPPGAAMGDYDAVMEQALLSHKANGIRIAATGDIFPEKRRMETLRKLGIRGCFPLLLRSTEAHVRSFLELGFKAYVVCTDARILDASFVGRPLDAEFLDRLPTGVDPCGENGEFHTFVFDGPIFIEPVKCRLGESVLRESFHFSDVLPEE